MVFPAQSPRLALAAILASALVLAMAAAARRALLLWMSLSLALALSLALVLAMLAMPPGEGRFDARRRGPVLPPWPPPALPMTMMAPWRCHFRGSRSAFQEKEKSSAQLELEGVALAAAGKREVLGNSAKAVDVDTLTPAPAAPSASFLLGDAAAEMTTARGQLAEMVQNGLGARARKSKRKCRQMKGHPEAWKWAASPLVRCWGKPRLLSGCP